MQTDSPSAAIIPQFSSVQTWNLHQAEVMAWAGSYTGPKFHAMLLDPPYHLTITKRFGNNGSAPAQYGRDGAFARISAGFMGQEWDGGDLAFRPETWAALTEYLYPGSFNFAFASSRGWHRMACAIEDAGMIIHPTIWLWNYANGFPKSTKVKDAHFSGHRYGLQALKPAAEPIICFQKPYRGRPVDCIRETGAGALWIDGGRIDSEKTTGWAGQPSRGYDGGLYHDSGPRPVNGRWPANLILCHLPDCVGTETGGQITWQCVEGCPVREMGEQSGQRPAGSPVTGLEPSPKTKSIYGEYDHNNAFSGYGDDGTAARFFYQAHWSYEIAERLAQTPPVIYQPKASRTEREAGLDRLPKQTRRRVNAGGLENEPRFAPIQVRNNHPTVKPIALAKYLATLLLPPVGFQRRILVPFAGVGSEMIGAVLAGFEEVVGIEQSARYAEIGRARLRWWADWRLRWGQSEVKVILDNANRDEAQIGLWEEW